MGRSVLHMLPNWIISLLSVLQGQFARKASNAVRVLVRKVETCGRQCYGQRFDLNWPAMEQAYPFLHGGHVCPIVLCAQ